MDTRGYEDKNLRRAAKRLQRKLTRYNRSNRKLPNGLLKQWAHTLARRENRHSFMMAGVE